MSLIEKSETAKRRPHSFTVRSDLMSEARALRLNTSRAAEAGIEAAVRKAKEKAWLEENAEAIRAYNERIEKHGTMIKPIWLQD
ncbi:MAG: type II toxin-antitoxin system CcdA family antitoxin [Hyphomicrobiaceae bacterium]